MENTIQNAYAEVVQVLNILGSQYKNEIPKKILKIFNEYENKNFKSVINKNMKIEDIHLSRKALVILSILNLKYWEKNPEKIEYLKQQYSKNEKEYQAMINQYKQKDWLQEINKKRNTNIKENTEETSLIEQKNLSIIAKIKSFIVSLIHRRK